jgi:sensor histidine kinase YesM
LQKNQILKFQRYFRKIAVWSTLAITFFFMLNRAVDGEYRDILQASIDFLVLCTYAVLIWQFNFWLDTQEPRLKRVFSSSGARLFLQSAISLLVGVLLVVVVEIIVHETIKEEKAPLVFFIFRGILQILFYAVRSVYQIQQVQVTNAQLMEMSAKAQMDLLRQQVNPHFLFNALNTLKTLVKSNNPNAQDFIVQLADVYRYLLQNNQKEKVSLREDLSIARSYASLIHARFEDNFKLEVSLSPEVYESYTPPNTFQLLIENAVKHNIIGAGKALLVEIYSNEGHIIIRNNLQPKRTVEHTTGLGLENIRQRYQLLSNREVKVLKGEKYFEVWLPILNEK